MNLFQVHFLLHISTHALTEGDKISTAKPPKDANFNSRPHGGRPTALFTLMIFSENFNSRPHGGRQPVFRERPSVFHFNSRPHGGRLRSLSTHILGAKFQLTPSRRATSFHILHETRVHISTHALTEGDERC